MKPLRQSRNQSVTLKTASGPLAQLPWIHMASDIRNPHDSIEILTLSQHHETHDNLETQSQQYITIVQDHRQKNRTSHLHSCNHMAQYDIMKSLRGLTPSLPRNYYEFNLNI